jgi:hypothetical protein
MVIANFDSIKCIVPKKIPLDCRLVSGLVAIRGFVFLILGSLLLFTDAHFTRQDSRPILWGIIWIDSEIESGLYLSFMSFWIFITAYGIFHIRKFGWWCLLVLILYNLPNELLMYSSFKRQVLITSIIQIIVLLWLWYRRKLY